MASLQTIDDALSVLEYLAAAGRSVPLSRLSRDLALSKARTHRVLATLAQRGYVSRDPESAQYGFGSMCTTLVAQARTGVSLANACSEALRRLWQATRETAYLAVLESDRAIVVDKLDSPLPVIATAGLGRALPLHAVSAGKVLLASRPDHELGALVDRSLAAYPEARPNDRGLVLAEVNRTRSDGYALNVGGFRDAVAGVAAAVRWTGGGTVAAAIAVCVPANRFRAVEGELRGAVLRAAAEASAAIGAAVDAGVGPAAAGKTNA